MSKRQTYPREFKLEAVRLLDRGEKPAAQLARELGVARNRLYKWRDQLRAKDADTAFPGQGRRRASDAELAALKRENERLREENDILKKPLGSLRESRRKVCVHERPPQRVPCDGDVPGTRCLAQRVLCLAPPPAEPSYVGE